MRLLDVCMNLKEGKLLKSGAVKGILGDWKETT